MNGRYSHTGQYWCDATALNRRYGVVACYSQDQPFSNLKSVSRICQFQSDSFPTHAKSQTGQEHSVTERMQSRVSIRLSRQIATLFPFDAPTNMNLVQRRLTTQQQPQHGPKDRSRRGHERHRAWPLSIQAKRLRWGSRSFQ